MNILFLDALILPLSLGIDRLLGDPRSRYHPVALLGSFIGLWGRPTIWKDRYHRIIGVLMWLVTACLFTAPFLIASYFLPWLVLVILGPFLLKFCLSWRSLEEHALAVTQAAAEDVGKGRKEAALMVSRDTGKLSHEQVLSAAYESLAENLVDSIIAPILYFGIFGLAGAALYRAANTMDAMLGYRDERVRIGWFSARMDDILNFVPARITGILLLVHFAVRGRLSPAYEAYRRDRKKRPGFNGGIPMAIMAGGVGVTFEKPGVYTMGRGERSLAEAGPDIIAAARTVTLGFTLVVCIALFLMGSISIYRGI